MELILQLAVSILLAVGLALPRLRGRVAGVLVATAIAALGAGALHDGDRELEVVFRFAGFDAADLRWMAYPVETTSAGSMTWALCATIWLIVWAGVLWLRKPGSPLGGDEVTAPGGSSHPSIGQGLHPFWAPLLAAWSGCALMLVLEKTAAPAGLVDPVPFDRALLPPSLAAAAMLAARLRKVIPTFLWLAVFVTVARLPLVIWGTLATQNGWGTSLDVHDVTVFANPFQQVPMEVVSGSSEQLGWLVWGPHLFVYPGLYMMSLGGIAFAVVMVVVHGEAALEQQREQRARHSDQAAS